MYISDTQVHSMKCLFFCLGVRLDTDEGDLSELLLENRKGDAKQAAKLYCTPLCHSNKAANDEL